MSKLAPNFRIQSVSFHIQGASVIRFVNQMNSIWINQNIEIILHSEFRLS